MKWKKPQLEDQKTTEADALGYPKVDIQEGYLIGEKLSFLKVKAPNQMVQIKDVKELISNYIVENDLECKDDKVGFVNIDHNLVHILPPPNRKDNHVKK